MKSNEGSKKKWSFFVAAAMSVNDSFMVTSGSKRRAASANYLNEASMPPRWRRGGPGGLGNGHEPQRPPPRCGRTAQGASGHLIRLPGGKIIERDRATPEQLAASAALKITREEKP